MSLEIISMGRINIDIVMNVDKLPKANEHVFSQQSSFTFGGSAANFATQAARLGVKTGLISCVGDDLYGELILKNLNDIGVDTKSILVLDKQPTGLFFLAHSTEEGDAVYAELGANKFLEKHILDEDYLARVRTLHISGGFPMLISRAIDHATAEGMIVSVDPGRAAADVDFSKFLKRVDLLFLNHIELKKYFGIEPTEKGLREFAKTFPGILIVKRGEKGSIATDGFEYVSSPIFEVPVVDTLGAGDSFAAGFVTAWTRSENIEQALNFANATASLTIMHQGAQNGQPDLQSVARVLGKHDINIHSILKTFRSGKR
ncbi:MAG: carbohydrate kinase family protein [Candidatus Thorarchaeota archaeon]|nr:carbohydrate kinase family protein [Candidatus Thorarchaeota archaeon]